MKKLVLFLIAVSAWGQTTINGDRTVLGKLDLSNATAFIPPSVNTDPTGACTNPISGKVNVVISLASGNLFSCVAGAWHTGSGMPGQSPNLRGAWSAALSYNPLDVVTYLGSSYWAILANTDVAPGSDPTKWTQIAAAGATGPAGSVGSTGPAGVPGSAGPAGTQGAAGPAGSSGAQGLTGSTGVAGALGPTGPSGAAGAAGPAGVAGQALRARGSWTSTTAYLALDSVSYNGSSYVAVISNTNVTPGTNTATWNLVGVVSTIPIQSAGTAVAAQNSLNFNGPMAATSNAGQSRIEVGCTTCEISTNKGVANGYAGLDITGRMPAANVPTNVGVSTIAVGNLLETTDISGGGVFETFLNGLLVQKQGITTPGYAGGGLHIIGNGYPNDPSWAALSAGVTTDMGNFTAHAPAANSLMFQNGVFSFLSDSGLTAGQAYAPTARFVINPSGVQLASQLTDPGCTTPQQVGRLWMNTGSTPNALATCINTGSAYAWSNPVSQITKGLANGYAALDATAKIPVAEIPINVPLTDNQFLLNNDHANLGVLPPGAVARNANANASDNVDVRDFGAVCNVIYSNTPAQWHDDTVAIQDALNYVSGYIGSGTVHLPSTPFPGGCAISSTIIVPNGVRLKGENMHTAGIVAMPNFPINSAIVSIGPVCYLNSVGSLAYTDPGLTQGAPITMRAGLEDITVNANNIVGSTAVASQTMQENSYLHNVAMYAYDKYGFDCQSYGCQNLALDKLYLIGDANPNLIHIHFSYANSRINVRDLTITGSGPNGNDIGVLIENSSEASVSDMHCERIFDCVKIDSGSHGEVDNVWGLGTAAIGSPSTHTMVHLTSSSQGGIIHQSIAYGSPVNIQDDLLGQTITDFAVPLHVSVPGQNIMSSSQGIRNFVNLMSGNSLILGNTTFGVDSGGGGLVQTFSNGMMIQKSGLATAGFGGGGLHIIGNGYANDPSWGAISAGASTDMGTFIAHAPSADTIIMGNGTLSFYANVGLTAGNAYSPTSIFSVTPQGIQILGLNNDPGCTAAGQVGRMWMNTGVSPHVLSTCEGTGNGYGWRFPVTTVFGRAGALITAQTGDYLASQVTNAVDQTQTYANPAWLTALAWGKLTGSPNIYGTVDALGHAVAQRGAINFNTPFIVADNASNSSTDISVPQANTTTSGYLAAADWNTFAAKGATGGCPAGQFVTVVNAGSAPTCVANLFSNTAGTATKAQQFATTVYTDQSNVFGTGRKT